MERKLSHTENISIDEWPISGLTSDSRKVKKGYLFAALPGSKYDGRDYIGDAVMHGARVILAPTGTTLPEDIDPQEVTLITDENPRRKFSILAAQYYKLQPDNIVCVTGTSGKTSTVSFAQQLWHLGGIKSCASLGTLGVRGPGMIRSGSLTTPDPAALHAELADLAAVGITHLAMEASSHGLDQYRLDGVKTKAAAFTNLSQDHLDYHKDMQSYFEAKARLFTDILQPGQPALINADDAYFDQLKKICEKAGRKVLSFGRDGEYIKLLSRQPQPHGQKIEFEVDGKKYEATLPLVGEFQVLNALCALGLVINSGLSVEEAVSHLENLRGVPGRLQLVAGHPKGAAVYIDYAHKPAALETVLKTLRPHTEGKLHCVFGCGVNRDQGKRPVMGKIAATLADVVVVTDDNPRDEEPEAIRSQILSEAPGAIEIGDRREAIKWAVQEIQKGDVLVIAGKGHELGQILGNEILPFDDLEEAQTAMEGVKA